MLWALWAICCFVCGNSNVPNSCSVYPLFRKVSIFLVNGLVCPFVVFRGDINGLVCVVGRWSVVREV